MKNAVTFSALCAAFALTTALAGPGRGGPVTPPTSAPTLGPLAHFDTDKNGSVTTAELETASTAKAQAHAAKVLEHFDADDNGVITTAEIRTVVEDSAEHWLEGILKRYDRNGDGDITAAEFRRGRRGGHEGLDVQDFDTDSNTTVSKDELVAAATAFANERQAEVLADFDTNADGSITSAELVALFEADEDEHMAELLLKFDTNKDGTITSAEVSATRPPVRGHGGPRGR